MLQRQAHKDNSYTSCRVLKKERRKQEGFDQAPRGLCSHTPKPHTRVPFRPLQASDESNSRGRGGRGCSTGSLSPAPLCAATACTTLSSKRSAPRLPTSIIKTRPTAAAHHRYRPRCFRAAPQCAPPFLHSTACSMHGNTQEVVQQPRLRDVSGLGVFYVFFFIQPRVGCAAASASQRARSK